MMTMYKWKDRDVKLRKQCVLLTCIIMVFLMTACGKSDSEKLVLRVANWEEYMDQGEWDEEDAIELMDGTVIFAESSMVEDFTTWYQETYGKEIEVEYSTFGTNEELYNQITLGDVYDLVCPSEYMIMKMMTEGMLEPFSDSFYDKDIDENYYCKGVSPYIARVYDNLSINGEKLKKYAAGYMWGTLGIVYNPEFVTEEETAHWDFLLNQKYSKKITIKDSVRDTFFSGICIYNYDKITQKEFLESENYADLLYDTLNATDQVTVDAVEEILSTIKKNVYSFETDSGKADMVSGKVYANQQWSGDAVYTMDQAEEDGVTLCYSVPEEASNLWFDGWVMLKEGIEENPEKKHAAEAFINFLSMPENAVRNMDYIGYTSVISGDEDQTVFNYLCWNYEADSEEYSEDEITLYDVSYFFGYDWAGMLVPLEQTNRQLYAQYPTEEVMNRCAVMAYFSEEGNERINRMWTNVRCFDLSKWFYDLFH